MDFRTSSPFTQPSLDQANFRVEFARERMRSLAVIEQEIRELDVQPRLLSLRTEFERGDYEPWWEWPDAEPLNGKTQECFALVSEVIHHLRCALDHLVYNLAWLYSGRERTSTAFPCVNSAEDEDPDARWSQAKKNQLRGVSPRHREMIRAHQPPPVGSGDWLGLLVELSNYDKHRLPVHVGAMHEVTSWPHLAYPDPDNPDVIVQPYSDLRFYIGLPDGSEALLGLRDLALAVELCLKEFAPDF